MEPLRCLMPHLLAVRIRLLWPMLTTAHLYKAKGYSLDSAYTANRIPPVIPPFLRAFHSWDVVYIFGCWNYIFEIFKIFGRPLTLPYVPYPLEANSESIPGQKVRSEVKRVGGGEDTRKTALAGLRWGCVQDKERAGSKSRLLSWLTRIVRQHCSPLFDYRHSYTRFSRVAFFFPTDPALYDCWKKRVEMVIERARKSLRSGANFSRQSWIELDGRLSLSLNFFQTFA